MGAFVHNGTWYSAPAFVTHFFLDNERRVYNDAGVLQEIEYGADNYVDPLIDVPKRWRDSYRYDAAGKCLGWTRHRTGEPQSSQDEFTAIGQTLLDALIPVPKGIRLLGLGLHNLIEVNNEEPVQLGLAIL